MSTINQNPFRVPHAANLLDTEIDSYWVDLGDEGGFEQIFRPSSLMPMIILGGKGSGKTHLMRHFSFELQKIRSGGDIAKTIREEKYVGIYLRASGLHASRFKKNGEHSDAWTNLFAFYVELWFTERLCAVIGDIFPDGKRETIDSKSFLGAVLSLFDRCPFEAVVTWNDLVRRIADLRRDLDLAINNCFTDQPPDTRVLCSRGALIFGIPKLLTLSIPEVFEGITFTWLLDEYEHFHATAQRYVNTLIREKQQPATFKVGVRLWGIYTYETFSNEEVLKKESEYEELQLDQRLRSSDAYPRFAMNIVRRRLENAGWQGSDEDVRLAFEDQQTTWEQSLRTWKGTEKRPWIEKLQKHLENRRERTLLGIQSSEDVEKIIAAVRVPTDPFLEKLNTFLLYRAWSEKKNLVDAAVKIGVSGQLYVNQPKGTEQEKAASKFKGDLLAQMRRNLQLPVIYTGFEDFVQMSSGVARSLLVTLKKIYDEALYSGERLFEGRSVSGGAQSRGVAGASEWFFEDVLIYGEEGLRIRAAIERLGRLFRSLRFSEKPSECSLNSFSFDPNSLSPDSSRLIETAVRWSVFIPQKDRLDRNSNMPHRLFRLSGMLCPKFELPLSSRGNIALSGEEIETLFSTDSNGSKSEAEKQFVKIIDERLSRCSPPFGVLPQPIQPEESDRDDQPELFGSV